MPPIVCASCHLLRCSQSIVISTPPNEKGIGPRVQSGDPARFYCDACGHDYLLAYKRATASWLVNDSVPHSFTFTPDAAPHLLLTGTPGSGKSTAIRRVAEHARGNLRGFYTEEIREDGVRRGFRLVSFDGARAVIAHVDFPKVHRVGKYGVDVAAIDEAVEAALAPGRGHDLYLVDEIGKMECLSDRFVSLMRALFDGTAHVVATVARRGEGFIDEVKRRRDCERWTLTRANRDEIPERILAWLEER